MIVGVDEQDVWLLRRLDGFTENGRGTNNEKYGKLHGESLSWIDMSAYKEGKDAWIRRIEPIPVAWRGDSIRGLSLPDRPEMRGPSRFQLALCFTFALR